MIKDCICIGKYQTYTNIIFDHRQAKYNAFKMASEACVDKKYIKTCFLEATGRDEFQLQWMSADTWAQLITKYCISDPVLSFKGSDLNKALNDRSNVLLREEMDLKTNVPATHIGIFRNYLKLHKEKNKLTTIMLLKRDKPLLT
jgi:hypothetical protein